MRNDVINEDEYQQLMLRIYELKDCIEEEFDMMEVIEDEIQDIFKCDLDCSTCSSTEQGKCMQNFRKANIFWVRKIIQDEVFLKDIIDKLDYLNRAIDEKLKYVTSLSFRKKMEVKIEESDEEDEDEDDNCFMEFPDLEDHEDPEPIKTEVSEYYT